VSLICGVRTERGKADPDTAADLWSEEAGPFGLGRQSTGVVREELGESVKVVG
jgi:hypothetical protein